MRTCSLVVLPALFLVLTGSLASAQSVRVGLPWIPRGDFQPLVGHCTLIGSHLVRFPEDSPALGPRFLHTDWAAAFDPGYAHTQPWYRRNWMLAYRGRMYQKSGPPEYLSIPVDSTLRLALIGSIAHVPIYADTMQSRTEYLYAQLSVGCALQEYKALP